MVADVRRQGVLQGRQNLDLITVFEDNRAIGEVLIHISHGLIEKAF